MARRRSEDELEREAEESRHRDDERPRIPDPDAEPGRAGGDIHAAGTGGGGYAIGGLRGSNAGDGAPDVDELEKAAGSGNFDVDLDSDDEPPYAGPSGGAVGGSPAEKRAAGGHARTRSAASEESRRADSTLGGNPTSRRKKG